jgi:hypothetical protein
MTITNTTNKQTFSPSGSTTYAVTMWFIDEDDLDVYREDAGGTVTLLTLTTDYSMSTENDPNGATLTTVNTYSDGKLTVYRNTQPTQVLDIANNDGFDADSVEETLDRMTMILQRHEDELSRCFKLADSDTSGADTTVPVPVAGEAVKWNATPDALETFTP